MTGWPYLGLMLAGLLVTGCLWARAAREDSRLPLIYVAALLGAMVGAKAVYLLAEGWLDAQHADRWSRWITGKSVLGGLLLGYPAVEWTKARLGYTAPTGDRFALVVPLGTAFGRLGCWLQGCCLGAPHPPTWYTLPDSHGIMRWPAVPAELAFNLSALLALALLPRRKSLQGQRFHLYLLGYGTFRFLHEFVRDTPRLVGHLSGYSLAALAVATLGAVGLVRRHRANTRPPTSPSPSP